MESNKPITKLNTKDFYKTLLKVHNDMARSATLSEALMSLVRFTTSAIGCERGTIFLHDPTTDELYSFIAQGDLQHEIRVLKDKGLIGWHHLGLLFSY